ncbi:hypothetical protein [Roseovarius pelagicus]|uniref:Uncharacterized protein n=1 Tax=Roseovarius pelagicus TaxID=2980108 RepID=A0ABY6D8F4_9RHOB|nr:hypothetical protein [Roseovarius pelagicus]UXX82409.1 hypothetical protein N7U68_15070 [Roseovarius pelagicus]
MSAQMIRLCAALLLTAVASLALAQQGTEPVALQLKRTDTPGSTGIQYRITLTNDASVDTPVFAPVIDAPSHWLKNIKIAPRETTIPAGRAQNFTVTYDVVPDAPPDQGETLMVYFPMGDALPLHQLEIAVGFGGTVPALPELLEPKIDMVEFRETFEAGSTGNGIVFSVHNSTAYPVEELSLRPHMPSQYMLLDRIEPLGLTLDPGETADITAYFSVREDVAEDVEDSVEFHFDTADGPDLTLGAYRLIALIEAAEEAETVAECNSAVEAGGDAGGGVTVDLGGFTGRAGFTWEMYNVKDQMNVTVGGVSQTTGCVSHSGTIVLDVPPGAGTAKVEVVPNCEGTTGTQWTFTFECPLASDVTADGSGNALDQGAQAGATGAAIGASQGTQAAGPGAATTGLGAPVQPAPPMLPPIQHSGATVAESDNNDDIASAMPIGLGDAATGAIDPRRDADFYRVNIPKQGELTIAFPRVPTGVNITFRVLRPDGGVISGWHTAPAAGVAFDHKVDISAAGTVMIEVRDAYNDADSPTSYVMQTSFVPTQDHGEPNDDLAQATPLAWNVETRANILPKGDADHYVVTAPRQGRMTVLFTESGPETAMTFRVLEASGAVLRTWQTAASSGAIHQAWVDLPKPGRYVIEVRDSYNDARSATPYVIVAALDQTPDNGEPNDTMSEATPITIGQVLDASILPKSDGDMYQIDLPHQGELSVDLPRSAPETNLTFRVLDAVGGVVRNWQTAPATGAPYRGWADIATPGRYIIEMRDAYNDAASPVPYRFETAFRPTQDWAEPNGTASTATPVQLDQSYAAHILPKADGDMYRVTVDHPGVLGIDVTASGTETNMTVRVMRADETVVRNWSTAPSTGAPFDTSADLPAAGAYLVEFRDAYNDARSADPYQFALHHTASVDVLEPNDVSGQATAIGIGQSIVAAIFPKGDHDLYSVTASRAGDLVVTLTDSPDALNMVVQVERPDGTVVQGWRGATIAGDLFEVDISISAPGVHILRFADAYSDARSPEGYAFRVGLR